ncbi:MAG: porin [Gemmatimonadaceae bacterium]|nr:porin [Gemmatimonadaceae bacterium]
MTIAACTPTLAEAQTAASDTAPKITVGAFVDGYFAWDVGRPPSFDRSFAGGTTFTTQPARHNEFNVNLAFIEVKLDAPRYRGRVALQTGTSVQSNYAGEPTNGTLSGPLASRMIQEAVAGVRLADNLWVDGGIFYSHLGVESWASRDNLTYTRSLVGDYSPYYQSGVKMTWTPTPKLTARVDLVNGWQNISENNSGKGAGARLDYAATSSTLLSYYNFFSNEAGSRLRTFNGVGGRHAIGRLTLLGEFDYGTQRRAVGEDGQSTWSGWTAVARVQAAPTVAFVARVEAYNDRDQVILSTGAVEGVSNPAFRAVGGSIGVDVTPVSRVAFRTELRGWRNRDAIFPNGRVGAPRPESAFVVTSLALSF